MARITGGRSAFLRSLEKREKFDSHDVILAENIDTFYPDSPYRNLIEFEIHIAGISDSVVLFSEEYGSLAELGAFSQIDQIAERILVLIQTQHMDDRSFIRDGPIRHLEGRSEKAVQVFNWRSNEQGGSVVLDVASFDTQLEDIKNSIRDRLADIPKTMTFNQEDFGHKIILAAAISDVLGAATFEDFKNAFSRLGVASNDSDIHRMLFCAHAVDWLHLERRGHQKFYLPNFLTRPCEFRYRPNTPHRDLTRWKRDIRVYWEKKETFRSHLISEHSPGGEPS